MSALTIASSPSAHSRSARLLSRARNALNAARVVSRHLEQRSLPAESLLHANANDPLIAEAVLAFVNANAIIIATPVYKLAYSGLLKVFLDLLPRPSTRFPAGRLLIDLVSGGDPSELAGDGVFNSHAYRYAAAGEFIRIWREIVTRSHEAQAYDFEGQHLSVKGAKLLYPPIQNSYPPVWFGGSSDAAHELAAEHTDTYLTWGEPPA